MARFSKKILELVADHDNNNQTDSWDDFGLKTNASHVQVDSLLSKIQDKLYIIIIRFKKGKTYPRLPSNVK
ncbi:MAG: hypothetical protein WCK98_00250 [bacterium]